MSHGDFCYVRDRIQWPWRPVKRNAQIARARLWLRFLLRKHSTGGEDETKHHCKTTHRLQTIHQLFFSQERFAVRSNSMFFTSARSINASCSDASFQSPFSTASVRPGNSRCAYV